MDDSKVVVVSSSPPSYAHGESIAPKTNNKKYVKFLIVGVCAVAITAVVVVGYVLAFKYHSQIPQSSGTNQRKLTTDDGTEEVIDDIDEFSRLYTVNTPVGQYKVLYDFNKNIRVVKDSNYCIIVPMNSSEVDPEEMSKNPAGSGEVRGIYKRDNLPIKDKSVMGKAGQELCKDDLVYWAFPTCEGDMVASNSSAVSTPEERQKRALNYNYIYYCVSYTSPPYYSNCPKNGYLCCLSGCGYEVRYRGCLKLIRVVSCGISGYCYQNCYWYIVSC